MTQIRYTDRAMVFADLTDGHDALAAKVELEVEILTKRGILGSEGGQFWFHIFSWNGTDNMIMTPEVDHIVVDLIEDGGDSTQPVITNGPEPDMPHPALMKDPDHG